MEGTAQEFLLVEVQVASVYTNDIHNNDIHNGYVYRWFTLTDHAVVHVSSPLSVSQNGSVELCSPMATLVNRF